MQKLTPKQANTENQIRSTITILRRQPRPQFLKWYKTFNWLFGLHDKSLTPHCGRRVYHKFKKGFHERRDNTAELSNTINLIAALTGLSTSPIRKQISTTSAQTKEMKMSKPAKQGSQILAEHNMSRVVRKQAFCICENKDADQLRCNREADQRLCFRYIDSTIPLLYKSETSSF